MAQPSGTLKDIDGNVYPTIQIGTQEWMAENLKTTRLNDGKSIALTKDNEEWGHLITPGYCWYNNDEVYKNTYGALYNWYAVMNDKLCPRGWHVPKSAEWSSLADFLGGESISGGQILLRGELKSVRTAPDAHPRWDPPNTGASNKSGFSALPAGMRSYFGSFQYLGKFGFWSCASDSPTYEGMRYDNAHLFRTSGNSKDGYSVRCLKDQR